MKRIARIAVTYALIAVVATVANIACQAASIAVYRGAWGIQLSVLVGTAAGLPIKYVLEKQHVFGFRAEGLREDSRLFLVYTFFGIFTTGLFWGAEYAFHVAFRTDAARYLGAAIGLTAGYIVRYQLDKRFVFTERTPATARA